MKCEKCGATGCKLWRLYQSFSLHLLCCDCAGTSGEKDVSQIDSEGKRPSDIIPGRFTFEIGWYVPAVPSEDGMFWGYMSIPQADFAKWKALPTRPTTDQSREE